jgi:hypothetical protein
MFHESFQVIMIYHIHMYEACLPYLLKYTSMAYLVISHHYHYHHLQETDCHFVKQIFGFYTGHLKYGSCVQCTIIHLLPCLISCLKTNFKLLLWAMNEFINIFSDPIRSDSLWSLIFLQSVDILERIIYFYYSRNIFKC